MSHAEYYAVYIYMYLGGELVLFPEKVILTNINIILLKMCFLALHIFYSHHLVNNSPQSIQYVGEIWLSLYNFLLKVIICRPLTR